jgi:hypothetical protein
MPRFSNYFLSHLSDNAVEPLLEPLDGLVALDAVVDADSALHATAASDTLTGAGHAAVEVHAVDTDARVVLDAEIDVLADTEAEVASLGEVALAELVLLDLEATLENLLSLIRERDLVSIYYPVASGSSKWWMLRRELTLGPRTVTWTAIFSLRRIPKVRTV